MKHTRPKSASTLPARKAFLDTAYKPPKKLPPPKTNAAILRMNETDSSGTGNGNTNGNGLVPDRLVDASGKAIHPDTKAYKSLRRALCFRQMESERSKVVQKLDDVEKQRRAISEDLRVRQTAKTAARELKDKSGGGNSNNSRGNRGDGLDMGLTLDLTSSVEPSPTTHSP